MAIRKITKTDLEHHSEVNSTTVKQMDIHQIYYSKIVRKNATIL